MQKKESAAPHIALCVLCTFLGVILAVMLGISISFHHVLNQINYTDASSLADTFPEESLSLPSLDGLKDVIKDGLSGLSGEENENTSPYSLIGGKNSGITNLLLIGQDRRSGEDRARSDTMILCTFNRKTKQITLTSFLRDLYVEIPGYSANRINAAYAWGGMPLLQETLLQNFGLHIDGCIEVDFTRFAEVIDLLGGIPMELRQDEADEINRTVSGNLTAGLHWLNGEQTLCYARIRKLDADGDFSRTSRQRKVISAVMEQYKNAGLETMLQLVSELLPMFTTDLTQGEIVSLGLRLFPMLSGAEISSQCIPAEGAYYGAMIQDMSVLVPDLDAAHQLLSDTLLP